MSTSQSPLKLRFGIDMERCPNCGAGELKIIAAILELQVIGTPSTRQNQIHAVKPVAMRGAGELLCRLLDESRSSSACRVRQPFRRFVIFALTACETNQKLGAPAILAHANRMDKSPASRVPRTAILTLACLFAASAACAQPESAQSDPDSSNKSSFQPQPGEFRLGAFGLSTTSANSYKGVDGGMKVYPWLYYRGDRLRFDRNDLSYTLLRTESWSLAPALTFSFNGYDSKDSPFLAGMTKKSDSVMLGVRGEFEVGWLESELYVAWDAGGSGGAVAQFELGVDAPLGSRAFAYANLGATFQNGRYNNHLFGVTAAEATAVRPSYRPGSSITPTAEVGISYDLGSRWVLGLEVEYQRLPRAITASPIVGRKSLTQVQFGLAYRWF
ncbi:MAG: MipA/OmpV family protein [Rubrivivax sp.]|nr:MipA/OmpV family protein [Rubrivivax sp.]